MLIFCFWLTEEKNELTGALFNWALLILLSRGPFVKQPSQHLLSLIKSGSYIMNQIQFACIICIQNHNFKYSLRAKDRWLGQDTETSQIYFENIVHEFVFRSVLLYLYFMYIFLNVCVRACMHLHGSKCIWMYENRAGLSLYSVALPWRGRIPSTTQGVPVSEPWHQTHQEF